MRRKGGAIEWVYWQTGSAQLLPRLLAGRREGPVFLASRRSALSRPAARADTCPESGRARLSYRRAEELFRALSGGRTLHQLRHSALTHLGADGYSAPLLRAKAGHASLRSLERYVQPGAEAVSRMTAEANPSRRRRRGDR